MVVVVEAGGLGGVNRASFICLIFSVPERSGLDPSQF